MSEQTQALAVVDTETGEVIDQAGTAITPYTGASELRLTPEEQAALLAPFAFEDVALRSFDNLLYLPQAFFRERLNQVFGVGQWILKPVNANVSPDGNAVFYHGQMYIRGCFVAEAIGEQKYSATNAKTSYATAYEGAKSDCITRCCKDLGIAADLWKPQFAAKWKAWKAGSAAAPAPERKPKGTTHREPPPPPAGVPVDEIDWSNPSQNAILKVVTSFEDVALLDKWARANKANFSTLPDEWQGNIKQAAAARRKILQEVT